MVKFFQSIIIIIISAPAVIAVVGAIVYVFYGLNSYGIYFTSLSSLIIIILIIKYYLKTTDKFKLKTIITEIPKNEKIYFIIFLLTWLIAIYFLYSGQSDRPILSPWQVVSGWFFLAYASGIIILFKLSLSSSKLLTPALILQSFLLFGTAVIVYNIGYGFDPFIHEAAIKAIEKLGQIKPLTPYYLGQYSLIIVLHKLTSLDLSFWSKILIPSLAAITLPLIIMRWLKNHRGAEKNWSLAAIFILILPATIFIVTTPQNLAYLFLLIIIFWPSQKTTLNEKVIIWFCALAALVTQPIAGIPAVLAALNLSLEKKSWHKFIYPLIIAGFTLAIPLAFYIFTSLDAKTAITLSWPNLKFLSGLIPAKANQETWWLNFIYLYNGLWGLIIFSLSLIGAWLSLKKKNLELIYRFFWPAIALIIAAILSSTINFHFLINYEQSNYPERLMITGLLFALPLIIYSFKELAHLIGKSQKTTIVSWIIIITAAATASIYLSYPRFDHYHNSHGYASSKADELAVKWIEEDSQGEPYVVLANQQVSAAALRHYGFKAYYNNIFYYPIPTSGELYKIFLNMVEKPDLKEINQAQNLTGVNKIYFVLNSYWWEYPRLATEAAFIANKTEKIGDGQIMIFKFGK